MKRLLVFILVLAMFAISESSSISAEEFLVADISNCLNLTIGVYRNAEIVDGEYSIINCTQLSPNLWGCECDGYNSHSIWMSTNGKTFFDYSFRVDKVEAYPSGPNTLITSLFTATCTDWSECIDNLQYKFCQWENGTSSTIAMSCFPSNETNDTNIVCESYWVCGEWSSCVNGSITRECTDLNDCFMPTSRPIVSQSCRNETFYGCEPDWSCGEWTSCINGSITRECTDLNDCFMPTSRPILNQTCRVLCTEDWSCGEWTSCVNGFQTRSCSDSNNCGTILEMPEYYRACNYTCIEDWECSVWSQCKVGNIKTRTCIETNECNTSSLKPNETGSCVYSGGNNGGNGGGSGGGSGGSGSSTDNSDYTDNIKGWICDPWGPCIDGRHSAFCYRYIRDSGLNYTKSEDCEEELIDIEEELEEPPIVIVGGESDTNNETLPPAEGSMGITGMFGLALPKQPWLWALLLVLVIAFLIFLAGKRNKSFLIAAGKRKKEKK